ncbi:putative membrane protein YkoI [Kroppenstedtia sanguinis]|uniref:PepSY domain-containing protein n=1 Tax=Kroppenstedtia sanguinis TaxID=1380684 RepID=A0ABW4CCV7_9BACL
MKKTWLSVLAGAVIISVAGMGANQMFASDDHGSSPQKEENQTEQKLSEQEVMKIAKDEFDGKVTEVELKYKGETPVYEVELIKAGTEAEIKVDSNSGKILKKETETKETDNAALPEEDVFKPGITMKQAEKIALHEAGEKGQIKEIKLEKEDGQLIYEVEIQSGTQETEIEMDAQSGKVLEVSTEQED